VRSRGAFLVGVLLLLCSAPSASAEWTPRFAPYRLYSTNTSDSRYVDVRPESVVIGDVTADGRPDVVLAVYNLSPDAPSTIALFVYPQQPDGSLGPRQELSLPWAINPALKLGDLNGDGDLDAVAAAREGLEIAYQQGGKLGPPHLLAGSPKNVAEVAVHDMNGDGRQDIVASGEYGSVVLRKTTAAEEYSSVPVRDAGVVGLSVADLDADSLPDLAGIDWKKLFVFHQKGDRSGYDTSSFDQSWETYPSMASGDFNGDGRADLAQAVPVNKPRSRIELYLQTASTGIAPPSTTYASYEMPESIHAGDLNGDGRDDVVVAHGGWDSAGYYLQQAGGGLAAEELLPLPTYGGSHYHRDGVAVGDVNCDGRQDIVTADYNYGLVVLAQESAPEGPPGSACSVLSPTHPAASSGSTRTTQHPPPRATTKPNIGARPRCRVPHLRGLSVAAARHKLRLARCRLANIRTRGRGRRLRVLRQRPAPGLSATDVRLVVGAPRHRKPSRR
jgi:hypothetical protein